MRLSRLLLPAVVTVMVAVPLPADAETPAGPIASTPTPDTNEALLTAIRKRLGISGVSHADEDTGALVVKVRAALADTAMGATLALAEVRRLVGAPPQPAGADDAAVVAFLRQMAAASPAPPTGRIVIRANPHPDLNVLEHSHMYFALHGMLFEAQIAPQIFFFDNQYDSRGRERLYATEIGGHTWAHSESFTPMIRLRNRNDTSGPIKTLSWMPKIDVQVMKLDRAPSSATLLTFHATVGHHSNGQDECTFKPGVLDREDLCPTPTHIEDVRINYPNGSFSTNYIKAGVVRKSMSLVSGPTSDLVWTAWSLGVYAEANPPGLKIGGTLPAVLRPLYGTNRLHGIAQYERRIGSRNPDDKGFFMGSVRVNGWLDYIDKIPPGVKASFTSVPDAPLNALYTVGAGSSRWRFGFEAAWNPDWLKGWGFEVRYDHGQDDYNMLYIRDIHWFHAGIVFDAAEFQPFKKKQR